MVRSNKPPVFVLAQPSELGIQVVDVDVHQFVFVSRHYALGAHALPRAANLVGG